LSAEPSTKLIRQAAAEPTSRPPCCFHRRRGHHLRSASNACSFRSTIFGIGHAVLRAASSRAYISLQQVYSARMAAVHFDSL
jgi:hypothetical protein